MSDDNEILESCPAAEFVSEKTEDNEIGSAVQDYLRGAPKENMEIDETVAEENEIVGAVQEALKENEIEGALQEALKENEIEGAVQDSLQEALKENVEIGETVTKENEIEGAVQDSLREALQENMEIDERVTKENEIEGTMQDSLQEALEENGEIGETVMKENEIEYAVQDSLREALQENMEINERVTKENEIEGAVQDSLREAVQENMDIDETVTKENEIEGSVQDFLREALQENTKIDKTVTEENFTDNVIELHEETLNNVGDISGMKNINIAPLTPGPSIREIKINWQQKIDELDERKLHEQLKYALEWELLEVLKETEKINSYLLKETNLYEFVLNEDETVQNILESVEEADDPSVQEGFVLSYSAKCYLAQKRLEYIEREFECKKAGYSQELQNLRFELESLNISLKDLKETKEKFDKNIQIGGRHPVTKKVILQKVAKFFNDSIRKKMALTSRYRIQIQSDIQERNKILSQIKAQEKRLASVDMTEFRETQFEHKKSCRKLAMYKDELGKFKAKFSPLQQRVTDMKRALEREESEMERMKNAVSKLEHLKEIMLTEKVRNDQKVLEMEHAKRKLKLDPRRHNLPEIIDYAAAKRQNAALKKSINQWKKKVSSAEQKKSLYLSSLSKKNV